MKITTIILSIFFLTLTNIAHSKVGKYQIIDATDQNPNWVWVLNTETGQVKVCRERMILRNGLDGILEMQPICSLYSRKD